MVYLGKFALVAAAIISIYVSYNLIIWLGDKRRNHPYDKVYAAVIGVFGAATLATLVLTLAFIRQDYAFEYVTQYSSADLPMYLKLAGLWAGQAGSMLLWLFLLSGFTALIAYRSMRNPDRITSYTVLILTVVQLFFLAILILVKSSDPFVVATQGTPATGLNPLLMHWAMVLHPPTLFIGYAGFTIPFAYALAAFLAKDSSKEWTNRAHKWALFAWLFLSVGIILGALWAYVVLSFGGYWAWDPVENASLLPWLTGVALMHSLTAYRRRGNLKIWTAALAVTTFILCIVATFITRSGLIQSVHAYERDTMLTVLFGAFVLGTIGVSYYLIQRSRERFSQEDSFETFASKQFTYYLNNVIMVAFAGIVLFASAVLPFFGVSWKGDNYNAIARPLGLLYLILVIACPLMGWVKTESKKLYQRLIAPGIVTLVAAVPIWMAWSPVPTPSHPVLGVMDSKLIGFTTMLLSVFLAVSVIELFVEGARVKAKNRGIGFTSAFFSIFRYNRSTAGGYLAHFGIAILMFGVVGSTMYVREADRTSFSVNKPGKVVTVGGYTLSLKSFEQKQDSKSSAYKRVRFDVVKNGKSIGYITPKIAFHLQGGNWQATPEVAIIGGSAIFNPGDLKLTGGGFLTKYNPLEDIYISLNTDQSSQTTLWVEQAKVNPLVSFVWLGSFILIFGTGLAYWPKRARAETLAPERGRAKVPVGV